MRIKKRITVIISLFLTFSPALFSFAAGQASSHLSRGRDPFRPLVDSQGRILIPRAIDIEGMSLEGIIYSAGSPVAIINGEVLSQEESIGEYTVLTISKKEVVLKKDNQTYTLKLEVD